MWAGGPSPAHAVRPRPNHQDATAGVLADLDDLAGREVGTPTSTLECGDECSLGIGSVGPPSRRHGSFQLVFGEQVRGVLVDQPGRDSRSAHSFWRWSRSVVPTFEPNFLGDDVKEAEGFPELGHLVLGQAARLYRADRHVVDL